MRVWIDRLQKFRQFLGPEVWRLFSAAIAIGALWFLVESSFAYILQGFLSTIGIAPLAADSWLARHYPSSVGGAAAFLFVFGAIRAAAIYLRLYFTSVTQQTFLKYQRIRILRHALNNAETESTPAIITLFNTRVDESGKVIQGIVYLINMITALILFSLLALWLAPIEFIISFSILAVALLPLRRLNSDVNTASSGLVEESRKVTQSILLGLRNNFLLRIYGAIAGVVDSGTRALSGYADHYRMYCRVYAAKNSAPHLIGVFAIAVVTYVSNRFLETPGASLLAFFYLFFRISQAASEANGVLNEIKVYLASFKELYHFNIRIEQAQVRKPKTGDLRQAPQELFTVELKDLTFSWSKAKPMLAGLHSSLRRGDVLLIKGESGSGKSTLLSIICGLISPDKGEVLFNGAPLKQYDFTGISSLLGYVGPDPYMIEGTVRDNLLLANSRQTAITDHELIEALNKSNLGADFGQWANGLEQRFSEFTQLSTGQKQRLAFARALVRKPQLLILDEATANLDVETEGRLIEAVNTIKNQLITIVISHRDSFDSIATQKIILGQNK